MKITIELDMEKPSDVLSAKAFSDIITGISSGSAEAATPSKPEKESAPVKETKVVDDVEDEDDETAPDEPRIYGAAGDGRKKRNKEEMAIDKEIDNLAEELNIKSIPTDAPAEEVLADLQKRHAEAEDKADDFDIEDDAEEEEDDGDEPMSIEDFRAIVIKAVGKHDADAKSVLKRYGSGLSSISENDRRRVVAELKALG